MRSLLDRYAAYWRAPGAPRFIAFSLFTRLPLGTVGLATLLHVRELTGSIAFAGQAGADTGGKAGRSGGM